jgi:hypothetical protein
MLIKMHFDFSYENISLANQITSSSGNSSYDCCLEKLKMLQGKIIIEGLVPWILTYLDT